MDMTDDPFRWLEDLDGDAAAAWVRERNAESLGRLTGDPRFARLRDELLAILDSTDRVPYPSWHDGHLYNLWKDRDHPRGLWRRTTLDEYRKADPDWDVLIDLDALAAREDENWVWQEASILRPAGRRCLVSLSRGGSDARVVREFDLDGRAFVPDGFTLPEAKSEVGWIDADRLYVGTDFGPGSLTASGYPRLVKEWRRGTPLADAPVIIEGHPQDVVVHAVHDPTPGFERDLVVRWLDFFRAEHHVRTGDGELVRIPVPLDADVDTHREWLLIRLRSAWTVEGVTHAAGTVLVTDLDRFLAGGRDLTVVFAPDPQTALDYHSWTRNHLILSTLADVRSRQEVVTPGRADPPRSLGETPDLSHTDVVATNPDHSDEYLLTSSGYTQPTTLWYGRVGGDLELLKQEPTFFDATGIPVRQYFATSDDGTSVPYFVVGRHLDAPGPALLTGYGGYEISMTPSYDGVVGRGWLAEGRTYAVANIRGGGEYGPAWHRAALRENRPRAYEDFAAVARDLVARGLTTPAQLGAVGGSNGGLLMGVMLTRYPELFGAIAAQVPVLDMRRYHRLLAGHSWVAEYGNPDDESDWAFLRAYSPYHNVHSGRPYPPVLLITSTRDDRVHPAHARKMAARLREHGYDVSYYENVEGGHGAAADNRQHALKWALILEFLRQRLA
jgi:prolyl oligopeptidase